MADDELKIPIGADLAKFTKSIAEFTTLLDKAAISIADLASLGSTVFNSIAASVDRASQAMNRGAKAFDEFAGEAATKRREAQIKKLANEVTRLQTISESGTKRQVEAEGGLEKLRERQLAQLNKIVQIRKAVPQTLIPVEREARKEIASIAAQTEKERLTRAAKASQDALAATLANLDKIEKQLGNTEEVRSKKISLLVNAMSKSIALTKEQEAALESLTAAERQAAAARGAEREDAKIQKIVVGLERQAAALERTSAGASKLRSFIERVNAAELAGIPITQALVAARERATQATSQGALAAQFQSESQAKLTQRLAAVAELERVTGNAEAARAQTLNILSSAVKNNVNLTEQQSAQLRTLAQTAQAAKERQESLLQAVNAVGRQFFFAFSQIILVRTAFQSIIRPALDFEREITRVGSLLDKTSAQILPELREGIIRVSREFGLTFKEATDAVFQALSTGVEKDRAIPFLEDLARISVATSVDLGTLSELIFTVQKNFSEFGSSEVIAAKLFTAVDKGRFTFQSLSNNLGDVVVAANAVGVSFDEALAAITAISQVNPNITEVRTQVKNLLLEFQNPTNEAKEAVAELQKSIKGFSLELTPAFLSARGIKGIFDELAKIPANQAIGAIGRIFPDKRVLLGINSLRDRTEEFGKLFTEISKSVEVDASKLARGIDDPLRSFQRLINALDAIKIKVFESLRPGFTLLINLFSGLADKIIGFVDVLNEITSVPLASFAIQAVALAAALGSMLGVVVSLGAAIKALTALLLNYIGVQSIAQLGTLGFSRSLGVLLIPITAVTGALRTLIATIAIASGAASFAAGGGALGALAGVFSGIKAAALAAVGGIAAFLGPVLAVGAAIGSVVFAFSRIKNALVGPSDRLRELNDNLESTVSNFEKLEAVRAQKAADEIRTLTSEVDSLLLLLKNSQGLQILDDAGIVRSNKTLSDLQNDLIKRQEAIAFTQKAINDNVDDARFSFKRFRDEAAAGGADAEEFGRGFDILVKNNEQLNDTLKKQRDEIALVETQTAKLVGGLKELGEEARKIVFPEFDKIAPLEAIGNIVKFNDEIVKIPKSSKKIAEAERDIAVVSEALEFMRANGKSTADEIAALEFILKTGRDALARFNDEIASGAKETEAANKTLREFAATQEALNALLREGAITREELITDSAQASGSALSALIDQFKAANAEIANLNAELTESRGRSARTASEIARVKESLSDVSFITNLSREELVAAGLESLIAKKAALEAELKALELVKTKELAVESQITDQIEGQRKASAEILANVKSTKSVNERNLAASREFERNEKRRAEQAKAINDVTEKTVKLISGVGEAERRLTSLKNLGFINEIEFRKKLNEELLQQGDSIAQQIVDIEEFVRNTKLSTAEFALMAAFAAKLRETLNQLPKKAVQDIFGEEADRRRKDAQDKINEAILFGGRSADELRLRELQGQALVNAGLESRADAELKILELQREQAEQAALQNVILEQQLRLGTLREEDAEAARAAIERNNAIIAQAPSLTEVRFAQIRAQVQATVVEFDQFAVNFTNGLVNTIKGAADGLTDAIAGAVFEGKDLLQSLRDFATSILKDIFNTLVKTLLQKAIFGPLLGGLFGVDGGGGLGAGTLDPFSFGGARLANGGVVKGLRRLATGGIVTRPSLAMIGEGRHNEAVVPLPDGRSIPVDLSDRGAIELTIVNTIDPESIVSRGVAKNKNVILNPIAEDIGRNGQTRKVIRRFS